MTTPSAPTPTPRTQRQARVAIIGRADEAAGDAAPRFIARLDMEPVVLAASPVADVIGRLESLRDLDFAIVLLSADPLPAMPAMLLEIGFLLGSLGHKRVCFVVQGQPPLMQGLEGVPRVAMDDAGLWRLLLAREMKQAGLEVDLNRAF